MTIQEAYKKAKESGYRGDFRWADEELKVNDILLDHLFWQSLGKAMGWNQGYYEYGSANDAIEMSPYLVKWHRFIDHLAEGKDAQSFFDSLDK